MPERELIPKVIFYSNVARIFRSVGIGYLYEISQRFPTILLAEELDEETNELLKRKDLFPFLEKVVPIRSIGRKENIFKLNKYVSEKAKDVISQNAPTMVVLATDDFLLDMYLIRYAKKVGAVTVCLRSALHGANFKHVGWETDMINAYLRFPEFLPLFLRISWAKVRKYLGYLLYNVMLPVVSCEKPFFGSSIVLYSPLGFRADYLVVFDQNDLKLSIEEGIPKDKIYILKHPLERDFTRKVFTKSCFPFSEKEKKILTIFFNNDKIGFKESERTPITQEEIQNDLVKVVSLSNRILNDWEIHVKLHPNSPLDSLLKNKIEEISPQILFLKLDDPADKHIQASSALMVFDLTTVFLNARAQYPEKPILAIDILERLNNIFYRDVGAEYINTEEKLISVLNLIKKGEYGSPKTKEVDCAVPELGDAAEMVKVLNQRHERRL